MDILLIGLAIIGWFLGLFILVSGPIAFIGLFVLQKQIAELLEQNRKLESTLRRLQHDIQTNRSETPKSGVITIETEKQPDQPIQSASPFRPAVPVVPFVTPVAEKHDSGIRKRFEDSGVVTAARTTAEWTKPVNSAPARHVEQTEEKNWQSLELWIGQKLFGWIAVIGFIIAAALLIQYSISMGWFTNSLKVAAIATFGTALLCVGWYSRRTGLRRFSTMMSSAGIILIYLAGYASFGFYHLISSQTASMVMPSIVFGGFLLAWFYRSKLLGTVTILGGLAIPVLLSSGSDRHIELFLYLMLLNIGTVLLVNLLRRAPIAFIAFFGTQALFWIWYTDYYTVEKIVPALLFQSAFYLVFLADAVIAALRPIDKRLIPTWDDAMRAVLAPIIFFGSVYSVSEREHAFLSENLGYFAFVMAAWYALLAMVYSQHLRREPATVSPDGTATQLPTLGAPQKYWTAAPSAATVIALGFVAIGIPLQFSATWITLGWLTVFAGSWFFGHRQTNKTFITMAYIFFGLGIVRLIGEMFGQISGVWINLEIDPVFNTIALPMLASASALIVAAVSSHRFIPKDASFDKVNVAWGINYIFGFLGYLLLGVILSAEAARFFYAHPDIWSPYKSEYLLSSFQLGFWFVLAVLLLEIGVVFRSKVVATVAFVGLASAVAAMVFAAFPQRCEYQEAFNNPFSIVLIAGSLILLGVGYQSTFAKIYREVFGGFGIAGLFMLIAILTIEFYNYLAPDLGAVATFRAVTVFWIFCSLFLLAPRYSADSLPLRICDMIILFAALLKTTFVDSWASFGYCSWEWGAEYSLEDWIPLFNPYFMTMLVPVGLVIGFAVTTNKRTGDCVPDCGDTVAGSRIGKSERIAWKTAGIIGLAALLIYLSVECYVFFDAVQAKHLSDHTSFLGASALTALWTVAALVLTTLALIDQSKTLRIISMVILWIAAMNVLLGLDYRPELKVPFFNLYFIPTLILTATLLTLGCLWIYRLDKDSTERKVYRFLAFCAVIFLWFTMTMECFQSVRQLAGTGPEAWKAQMALSILWSLFAGILIAIGFIWRSSVLRWMAILLFAMTLGKIVIVDMSGVNELYRFGAVIALATLLALAAWAYQRFKPEE